MKWRLAYMLLPMLVLSAALAGERVGAWQGETEESLPGVVVETLGRVSIGEASSDELVLLRVTIEPGASIPASDGPRAAALVVEEGRAGVVLEHAAGEVNLTVAGDSGAPPLTPGVETALDPGDTVTSAGAQFAVRNAGDREAVLLFTAVIGTGDPLLGASQEASGTFSVETFACPAGMSLATLDMAACALSAEPLVHWSLDSEQFDAPRDSDEAVRSGATTTWSGLPSGTYFVDLTAETFAPGYGDYFIPSSNQVTRQDERTTRIYFDAARSRAGIDAYVFTSDPATP